MTSVPRESPTSSSDADREPTPFGVDKSSSCNAENEELSNVNEGNVHKWPFFLINLSLTLLNCGIHFNELVVDQYIYQVSAQELAGNVTVKTSSNPCPNSTSSNSSMTSLVSDIQSLTSSRLLYLDLTSYGIAILSNIPLGAYSNVLNRKLQVFIPTFGRLVRYITVPVIVFWKLDASWLFLGYVLDGLCGSLAGIYLGAFLYTCDVTPRNSKRTLGVIIVESIKNIVTSTLFIATGHLIQKTGFLIPSGIAAGFAVASILVILALPNLQPRFKVQSSLSKWSPTLAWNTLWRPYSLRNGRRVRKMIVLGSAAFFTTLIWHAGVSEVRSLLFMNLPFCWDAIVIGWFQFGRQFGAAVFMMVAVATLHRHLPGMMLGIVGVVSYFAGLMLYSFAMEDYQLYIVPVVAIAQYIPLGLIRGELSRLLDSSQQGPLFAALAVMESIAFAISCVYLYIYRATLSYYPRPVFLISGCIAVTVLAMMIWFQKLWRKHNQETSYLDFNVDDSEVTTPTEKVI